MRAGTGLLLVALVGCSDDPAPGSGGGDTDTTDTDTTDTDTTDTDTTDTDDTGDTDPPTGTVPEFGATPGFTIVADAGTDLRVPRDLGFHPDRPQELWIVNRAYDGVVILFDAGLPTQMAERRIDARAATFHPLLARRAEAGGRRTRGRRRR